MRHFFFAIALLISFQGFSQLLQVTSKDSIDGKPKTKAYLKARIKVNSFIDFAGIPNESAMSIPSIPTSRDNVEKDAQYHADLYQSRVGFGSVIQTKKYGPINAYIEGDFFGDGGGKFRLRHAYVEIKNFKIGHTWSVFTDEESWPNITDFDGPATGSWVRNSRISYTLDLNGRKSMAFSIEKPSDDFDRYLFIDEMIQPANQTYPDFAMHYKNFWDKGHFQIGGVARLIEYKNNDENTHVKFGGGLNISGSVRPNGIDKFLYQVAGGYGISRYLVSFGGGGWDALPDLQGDLKLVNSYGGYLAYQYYWGSKLKHKPTNESKLSSTLVYGYVYLGNPLEIPEDSLITGSYASANLYWHMLPELEFAIEGIYGYRTDEYKSSGDDFRLQLIMEYSF